MLVDLGFRVKGSQDGCCIILTQSASVYLPTYPHAYLPIYLSIYLSVYLSVYPSVY